MNKGEFGTVNPCLFEWIIPNLQGRLQNEGDWLRSPKFYHQGVNYILYLRLDSDEWIEIWLYRNTGGYPKTLTYKIKIAGRTDVAEITKTSHFDKKNYFSGEPKFLKKDILKSFLDSTTIICYMTYDSPHQIAGKEFVNRGVERKVPDTKSCGIQTDVANGAIAKENPKDKDWSPLEMKSVALLSERMKELLINGIEPDVTICVQDKEFRAHRSILIARSPVFAMMLTHDSKESVTSTINIEDCDPESFDEFLLHVYSGRTENLTPSNALQLYYPADKYDFPVLKERCVNMLKASLSASSICDVVLLAAKYREKELLEVVTEFFAQNLKEILVTVNWQNFLSQNPVEANELYIKSMNLCRK